MHRIEKAVNAGESTITPAFFRIRDVLRITALRRATLYRRIADGKFPQPVRLGGRACGWTAAALQGWIDDPQGFIGVFPDLVLRKGAVPALQHVAVPGLRLQQLGKFRTRT